MGGSHRVRAARFFCCCIVRQGFNKNLYPQSAYPELRLFWVLTHPLSFFMLLSWQCFHLFSFFLIFAEEIKNNNMHFKWKYDPLTPEKSRQALELSEKLSMSPTLTGLLVKRGITTESAAKRFFRPQLSDLINPFLMKDMDVAVDRLNDAMGVRSECSFMVTTMLTVARLWHWSISSCNSFTPISTITFPTATTKATA